MIKPNVCVAICTHNRPRQLQALLEGLTRQEFPGAFPVIVIDNGSQPANDVLNRYRDRLALTLERIPDAGLAAVRNRAIELVLEEGCDFLAFIDDDEVPVAGWLFALMQRQSETDADLVFGPVLATYRETPPGWVTAGGFFERWGDTPGSGNALIRLAALPAVKAGWFQPAFALTGGEDAEFFDRMIAEGARSAIARDAVAHEDTPPARTTVRFIWRRGLRDGVVAARRIGLRKVSTGKKLWAGAGLMMAKLGHALNHVFWAMFTPWRAVKAIADLGFAVAVPLYAIGVRFQFYGVKPKGR